MKTAEEWDRERFGKQVPEFLDFIRAIQRDALIAAARICDRQADKLREIEKKTPPIRKPQKRISDGDSFTAHIAEVARARADIEACASRIRELKP